MTDHEQRARAAFLDMQLLVEACGFCIPDGYGDLFVQTITKHFPDAPGSEAVDAIRRRHAETKNIEYVSFTAEIHRDRGTLLAAHDTLAREVADLRRWVNDLQSGMYINCVYCGHRYGPKRDTPVAMADVLKAHVEQCHKHPMAALKQEVADLRAQLKEARP